MILLVLSWAKHSLNITKGLKLSLAIQKKKKKLGDFLIALILYVTVLNGNVYHGRQSANPVCKGRPKDVVFGCDVQRRFKSGLIDIHTLGRKMGSGTFSWHPFSTNIILSINNLRFILKWKSKVAWFQAIFDMEDDKSKWLNKWYIVFQRGVKRHVTIIPACFNK